MKLRKLRKLFIFFMFVGVIGLGLTAVFGANTITFIHRVNIEGITYYEYDFSAYMYNLANAFQDTSQLNLSTNPLSWQEYNNNINDWQVLLNNLAYMFNWVIFGLNILLYPFRIGAYIISIVGSIIGLPITTYTSSNGLSWLFDMINFLKGLEIPMITTT